MSPYPDNDIALLKAVLLQESKRGCDNRAVMGGLDRFIANWLNKNRQNLKAPAVAVELKNLIPDSPHYADRNPEERRRWIEAVLIWLEKLEAREETGGLPRGVKPSAAVTGVPAKPAATAPAKSENLDLPVDVVKGVGKELGVRLSRLGVDSVRDMLYFFPRRYLDFSRRKTISQLEVGKEQTIFANIWEARIAMLGNRRSTEAIVGDETGNVRAVWFNQPYLARQFHTNSTIVLSGRVSEFNYVKVFENPEWELLEDKELIHTGRLVPVYPLTRGLFPRQLRTIIKRAVDTYARNVVDFLPLDILGRCGLLQLHDAIVNAHFPEDYAAQQKARRRLAFDELFLLQLGVLGRKREWQEDQPGQRFSLQLEQIDRLVSALPFSLTAAQKRVEKEIVDDLCRDIPMSRLLQGDVGSGKTVVAALALLMAVESRYQGALMAPTEILAEQHFATLHKLFSAVSTRISQEAGIYCFEGFLPEGLKVALLTGSTKPKDKARLHKAVKDGEIDIMIGTHALIQKNVHFNRLGLVVIDEQHRFGVLQRSTLRQKGFNPHLLVMTATPIPRTLAMTLYGDLDVSTIDQMPPGRHIIKTRWIGQQDRDKAYNFIRKQVAEGRQAFVICPLIEESENLDVKAAVAEYQRLSSDVFPDLKLGLLHGKMKPAEKELVMRDFKNAKLDILISTSVVEVGIDVPNATVMLVEAADRFGLSQLHQFRGRVGRGEKQSYCLLLSENPSAYGQERLKAIEEINDGFLLAEKDLELRGPGEFFGTRQSGLPDLKMAKLSDTPLLETARKEARLLFEKDPRLARPEYQLLSRELNRIWQKSVENN
ncbi:MAG: ATP-dependent DNA helicase RecG [Dehalococcoidia bacterium]|nr:ATP-dependent DNA helicase RecG [Dehalococcoidia bacterium]MDD5494686.1 ATP-dependent DNA helicase RecG [Dehalococcoidia bacterium]